MRVQIYFTLLVLTYSSAQTTKTTKNEAISCSRNCRCRWRNTSRSITQNAPGAIVLLTYLTTTEKMKQLRTSNYDPSTFDPNAAKGYNNADGDAGTTQISAKPGQKMQVNITMQNFSAAKDLTVELFNWMTSATKVLNTTYVNGAYKYIPLLTFEGIAAKIAGTGGTIGFDQAGNMEIHGNDATPDALVVIGCGETPYVSFFEASAIIPFAVAFIRMTCTTDAQIDNQITWFQRTFSGAVTTNKVSPRAYFKPNQFQNLTIDITAQFPVGIDAGIYVLVNRTENLRHSYFINYWTQQSI